MPRPRSIVCAAAFALCAGLTSPDPISAQIPLGFRTATGLSVTPAFEGWYQNADGSFSLSFGYFNRNFEEVVEIPAGAGNHIEPADFDGPQPTQFSPRRHWGVFTVTVPADFGDNAVVWTIDFRGERYSIPGTLHTDWQIDALEGEAGSGNTPPVLAFSEGGPEGAGPAGIWSEPVEARAGTPVPVTVWARDDGRGRSGRATRSAVDLTWFKHQGPGQVTFSETEGEAPISGGRMTTMATFAEPGKYVLRVRANDVSGVSRAGHAQCCWTNGFVRVHVTH
ncbi:MAG: hypothetical protein OXE96_15525 [Gemmatimonadetes bacterium]|nr:hypothetical protein [Gemmatimonadota bacterium]